MPFSDQDSYFIEKAIEASQKSVDAGGYPVGAVIVVNNAIIAEGLSNGKKCFDATMHAEVDAIRKASQKLKMRNLSTATLYTSLEPCVMCFSVSFWAYIPRIIFACNRARVKKNYYMGDHNIAILNKKNRRKIELLHFKKYTKEALNIIDAWESSSK